MHILQKRLSLRVLLFATAQSTNGDCSAKSVGFCLHKNRQLVYNLRCPPPLCIIKELPMYSCLHKRHFIVSLPCLTRQSCPKMAHVHRLSVAEHGSKPRDNALCTVCCMETIYVSLCDTTNRAFLFSQQLNQRMGIVRRKVSLFVCTKTDGLCTMLSSLAPLYTIFKQAVPCVIPVLDTGISSSRVGSFTVKALSGELCQIAYTQFEIAVYGLYQFA